MSMSSQKFSALTSEFPEERETVSRLGELIGSGRRREMTLDHLINRLRPKSDAALARILERLVFDGTIGRIYRVESPVNRGPIEDFASFEEIPDEVPDWHSGGAPLAVTPRNLRVIYALT